jgi:hypothetical protein
MGLMVRNVSRMRVLVFAVLLASDEIASVSSDPIPLQKSGMARAGIGGTTIPSCIHCRPPNYPEEARAAKYIRIESTRRSRSVGAQSASLSFSMYAPKAALTLAGSGGLVLYSIKGNTKSSIALSICSNKSGWVFFSAVSPP